MPCVCSNFLVSSDEPERVLVCDFGMSRQVDDENSESLPLFPSSVFAMQCFFCRDLFADGGCYSCAGSYYKSADSVLPIRYASHCSPWSYSI